MSEERLLSYLATATARPVKAKIELPFTTGLSLDRKKQTVKKCNRDAGNKTCILSTGKLCYSGPGGKALAMSKFIWLSSSSEKIYAISSSEIREGTGGRSISDFFFLFVFI